MEGIGHNSPPTMVETTADTMKDISAFLAENPLIDEAHAQEAKLFIDRGKLCLKDLEDERDAKVRPLNEQVKEINQTYKVPKDQLAKVLEQLSIRLQTFIEGEEQKRLIAAAEARRLADEAEQRAREAERVEQDAIGSADSGELGVDIAAAVVEADDAFRAYQRAERAAALADRGTRVKVSGGFSRAIGLKAKETLVVTDATAALNEIGVTDSIKEAILTGARAFRKLHGRLPEGIAVEMERKI